MADGRWQIGAKCFFPPPGGFKVQQVCTSVTKACLQGESAFQSVYKGVYRSVYMVCRREAHGAR
jgi:hypothetical protein